MDNDFKPMTSEKAISILKDELRKVEPIPRIYMLPDEIETVDKVLAYEYALAAIKERDELYSKIDDMINRVRGWSNQVRQANNALRSINSSFGDEEETT